MYFTLVRMLKDLDTFIQSIYKDENFWMVGSDYTSDSGGLTSFKSGQPLIGIKWEYAKNGWKDDDKTLTVTG